MSDSPSRRTNEVGKILASGLRGSEALEKFAAAARASLVRDEHALLKALEDANRGQTEERDRYHSKRLRNSRKYREALRIFRVLSPEDQAAIWRARKAL